MTLSDKEYQRLRDMARRIISRVGVETGGSNIQFAVDPDDGRVVAIEMNPRVSRSSALASKATGFPIAKIAAKLALGYHLDEIPNDITRVTPASFEPSIDYVVVKVPRWNFEKFPGADRTLTTQMKSVGEAMAIGRTFKEAFLKGLRSLELGRAAWLWRADESDAGEDALARQLAVADERRIWRVFRALELGWSVDRIHRASGIDPWFLAQFEALTAMAAGLKAHGAGPIEPSVLRGLKHAGFSDEEIARLSGKPESDVASEVRAAGLSRAYKRIDTCAAEFESFTPYLYGTFADECEADPTPRDKVVILGSGPNRIGQGIEFDYCCCHAAFALREEGVETVMVNCNPETVSTDYDTADRLYFEPLTLEDVLAVIGRERQGGGRVSCLVQFGGQTPLQLALALDAAGVRLIGTSADSIDLAEDRERFSALLADLGIGQPASGTATSREEARDAAAAIGYPVVVRPSYVLGGRGMAIVYEQAALDRYMAGAVDASPEHPVLIDRFLEDAFELDVDALADATGAVVIGGIMEHIEEAGIHSGDSSCVLPTYLVAERHLETIRDWTRRIAKALHVVGLMNIQFAIKDDVVYVLEVNPRASRTVPFLSKATGVPLAKAAARVMIGRTLAEIGLTGDLGAAGVFVKTPVFPFIRFQGVDTLLGPEMKSTGEAMGCGSTFGVAFTKAQASVGQPLPDRGAAFISVNDHDKPAVLAVARDLVALGFTIAATRGTAAFLAAHGIAAEVVYKVNEGRPNIADQVVNGRIALVVNTPLGRASFFDDRAVRRAAMLHGVPCITTLTGAAAAVAAIRAVRSEAPEVRALQDYYAGTATR
jgi:carbamoyl-phosphate synthase large subunit